MSAWLTGACAVLALLGAGQMWVVKHIVRDEMVGVRRDVRDELVGVRRDIEVLRLAVFNHLSHGERASESEIRERLGYGHR